MFDNAPEVIAIALSILALLIFIFCTIMAAFKWKKQKHSTDKLLTFNYGLFAINCIIGIIIDNTSFYNNACNYNCDLSLYNSNFTNILFDWITHLVLVMHSGMILFRILNVSRAVKIITGIAIIAVSIILKGGRFTKFLLLIIGTRKYYALILIQFNCR